MGRGQEAGTRLGGRPTSGEQGDMELWGVQVARTEFRP